MNRITKEESKQYRKLEGSIAFRYNMSQAISFTLSPEPNGWEKVTYYGASWIDPTGQPQHPHYIYVLTNPSVPGVCKIGYTTQTVYERTRQINSATGVIIPWIPTFSYKCPNGLMLEQEIHTHLELLGFRVNPNREGFIIDSSSARNIIESIGKKYQSNYIN